MRILIFPLGVWGKGHIVRDLLLAKKLREHGCVIKFACDCTGQWMIEREGFDVRTIVDVDESIHQLKEINLFEYHTEESIQRFVNEELELIFEYRPDIIIGDMRFTAKLSSMMSNVRFVPLTYALYQNFVSWPVEIIRDYIPQKYRGIKDSLVHDIFRTSLKRYVKPYNEFLKKSGCQQALSNFFDLFTGELVLLTDIMEFYTLTEQPPSNVHFIGPLLEECVELPSPEWFLEVRDRQKPIILCCYGAVARREMLECTVAAFTSTQYQVIITLGGIERELPELGENFRVVKYLDPFEPILKEVSLIIFPGGAETLYRAIRNCVPMITVPRLLEHRYNSYLIQSHQIGKCIEVSQLTPHALRAAADAILSDESIKSNLKKFQQILSRYNGVKTAAELISRM